MESVNTDYDVYQEETKQRNNHHLILVLNVLFQTTKVWSEN